MYVSLTLVCATVFFWGGEETEIELNEFSFKEICSTTFLNERREQEREREREIRLNLQDQIS